MDREPFPDVASWWHYRAQPDPWSDYAAGTVDGDTLDLLLDQGLRDHTRARLRLAAVDTAEVYGVARDSDEYERGQQHSDYTRSWLLDATHNWSGSWPLVVATERDDTGKYGRLVARVARRSDGEVLNQALVAEFPDVADP